MIERIVSGGQTGVDRAALEVALERGIPCGGWCPAGRLAEDGPLADRYPLRETPSAGSAQRTAWNVRDSDGTLVLLRGEPAGGTALTLREAAARGRPAHAVCLDPGADPQAGLAGTLRWLRTHGVRVLNVAGPRESEAPGIGEAAAAFLVRLLDSAG